MDFSFVIITNDSNIGNCMLAIHYIHAQEIPNYEIIIVGGTPIEGKNITHIPFDENVKPNWITRKKNLGWQAAKYENVVFLHDYIKLDEGWYKGFLQFGNDWEGCVNRILHQDGSRAVDWCLPNYSLNKDFLEKIRRYGAHPAHDSEIILCYSLSNFGKHVYMPGNFFVAKRKLMEEFPQNENLLWGQAEDVEWSQRVQQKYGFSLNIHSSCSYLKYKHLHHSFMRPEFIEKLKTVPL
jgi:hypothetical protein